ncbi:hypothetical protein GFGA_1c0800 [Gluconobacter frateurii NBRC 103465]|nr:hypothetical protein GFGA_1c0800 [Gluconobacter frateurii NBRC 103465]
MSSMRQLIQVVANPSQLATQLTEFTADRSAAMVRQNGILQQCSDPVSGRGVAEKPGALAPPCQFVRRGPNREPRGPDTGWRWNSRHNEASCFYFCCGGQRGRYSPLPAVKRLPLGSRLTLLAQLKRTSENRIAIQASDFRKRQKKNENTSALIIFSHRLTENIFYTGSAFSGGWRRSFNEIVCSNTPQFSGGTSRRTI